MKIGERQFLAIPLNIFQISNIIGLEIISPILLKKIDVLWYFYEELYNKCFIYFD